MAAAVVDPQQLLGALVELVVADAGVVQASQAQCLDRRFVVEGGQQQRRGADEVTGGHGDRVVLLGLGAELVEVAVEVFHATGRDVADPSAGTARRLEVAVEVVERQQLDLDRLGAGGLVRTAAAGGASGGSGAGGDQRGRRDDSRSPLARRGLFACPPPGPCSCVTAHLKSVD